VSISAPQASIVDVGTTDEQLIVSLDDGREVRTPLAWYPRLVAASPEERGRWELLAGGEAVSWPDVDEDLSLAGMLAGIPAPGFESGPKTPAELASRQAVEAARDFFGESLGQTKALILQTRSQLTDFLDQLPESSMSSLHERIGALAASLDPILETVDDAAYAVGAEDVMNAASSTDPRTQAPAGAAEAEDAAEVAGEQEFAGEQEVVGQEAVEQTDDARNATTTGSLR
jgi:hypothetical protein